MRQSEPIANFINFLPVVGCDDVALGTLFDCRILYLINRLKINISGWPLRSMAGEAISKKYGCLGNSLGSKGGLHIPDIKILI